MSIIIMQKNFYKWSHINGGLIGGASLDAYEFLKIYNIAEEINNELI